MGYKGSCHCGKISYEVNGNFDQVYECNCSICSRRGYLLWFTTREQLSLKTPEQDISEYTFNTHKIKHHFCATCGCATFGTGVDKNGVGTAAINVRCLEGVDLTNLKVVKVDGRSL